MAENPMTDKLAGREVIFEMKQVGNIMRVSAMDVSSLTEVVIQGPVSAPETVLRQNALRRLEYVLRKEGLIK